MGDRYLAGVCKVFSWFLDGVHTVHRGPAEGTIRKKLIFRKTKSWPQCTLREKDVSQWCKVSKDYNTKKIKPKTLKNLPSGEL